MSKQLQWAIGGLALLIVGSVALQIYLYVDKQRFKEEHTSPEPKTETESEQPPEQVQVPEVDNRPPPPDDGREYVWHGDHWDPVDSPHAPTLQTPFVVEKGKTYDGPLKYDEGLFKTNPVKALTVELEARGHWAAKYIPPFPPDDLEAQELARYEYMISFMDIQDGRKLWDLVNKKMDLWRSIDEKYGRFSARAYDIARLTWPSLSSSYRPADFEINGFPSEYFQTRRSEISPEHIPQVYR